MHSIGQVSKQTGISAFTLRYYENIGLLPRPRRRDGSPSGPRVYSDQDIQFIEFVQGLKEAGMKLKDIVAFVDGGCIFAQRGADLRRTLERRIAILEQHAGQLGEQIERLSALRRQAREKSAFYAARLSEHTSHAAAPDR